MKELRPAGTGVGHDDEDASLKNPLKLEASIIFLLVASILGLMVYNNTPAKRTKSADHRILPNFERTASGFNSRRDAVVNTSPSPSQSPGDVVPLVEPDAEANSLHEVLPTEPASQRQVICMGLPKSGTTSVGHALHVLGFRVAHHQGDKLSQQCDVIINTMEGEYRTLDIKYPNAQWIVVHSSNTTEWLASVWAHRARKAPRGATKEQVAATPVQCSFYGCGAGSEGGLGDGETIQTYTGPPLTLGDQHQLRSAHDRYYHRLFQFLEERNKPYAVVDVRQGTYTRLDAVVGRHVPTPFSAKNSKNHRGGFPKC